MVGGVLGRGLGAGNSSSVGLCEGVMDGAGQTEGVLVIALHRQCGQRGRGCGVGCGCRSKQRRGGQERGRTGPGINGPE